MYFFYVHASGNQQPHSLPLTGDETPVFTLSALGLHERTWSALHRGYVDLKREAFPDETREKRPEHFLVSGDELTTPGPGDSTRNGDFLRATLRLCESLDVVAFSASFIKSARYPYDAPHLDRLALQHLTDYLEHFLATRPESHQGILIADSTGPLRHDVAQDHIDGRIEDGSTSRIVEAPLLAEAELTTGVQVAAIIGRAIYANTLHRYCRDLDGAPDYEHMTAFWPHLDRLQFRGPPLPGETGITYGYRVAREPDSPVAAPDSPSV